MLRVMHVHHDYNSSQYVCLTTADALLSADGGGVISDMLAVGCVGASAMWSSQVATPLVVARTSDLLPQIKVSTAATMAAFMRTLVVFSKHATVPPMRVGWDRVVDNLRMLAATLCLQSTCTSHSARGYMLLANLASSIHITRMGLRVVYV